MSQQYSNDNESVADGFSQRVNLIFIDPGVEINQ